ncbi:MAG: anaerobic ribonucleoside-triphosphate reductase activating protein [Candidatus Magasanikbacteria bacterium]|nr:anaerobic ribonucleoside-triphosphate reductase activating protein [Candidatus Magasanikbacteria bacterium]
MLIDGLQKLTLLDYPGKVAATIFTFGCNFRCGFCHNPELVLLEKQRPNPELAEEKILEFLRSRQGFLEGVVITGGEPTLQPDLEDFIFKAKALGFLVKLDTNGAVSAVLSRLLARHLLDFVAMDIKNSPGKYAETAGRQVNLSEIKKSVEMIKSSGVDYEFRSTLLTGLHSPEDILEMARFIGNAKKYVLQRFVSRPELVDKSFVRYRAFSDILLKDLAKKCEEWVERCEIR